MLISEWLRRLFAPRDHAPRDDDATAAEFADEGEVNPFDPFTEPVRLEMRDVLDLHAFAPRDIPAVVREFLREARRGGFLRVRIIHGKGVGQQRERVRRILARTPFVEHFSDAPPEAGGWGATVARLTPHKAEERGREES